MFCRNEENRNQGEWDEKCIYENRYQSVETGENCRYHIQRHQQQEGNQVGEIANRLDDTVEGMRTADVGRRRVVDLYGTGYAVRWALSPKGRVGLMTPDRNVLSAPRRSLPQPPETVEANQVETKPIAGENSRRLSLEPHDNPFGKAEDKFKAALLSDLCIFIFF